MQQVQASRVTFQLDLNPIAGSSNNTVPPTIRIQSRCHAETGLSQLSSPLVAQPVDQRHISTEVLNCRHTTFLGWWSVFMPSASVEHQIIRYLTPKRTLAASFAHVIRLHVLPRAVNHGIHCRNEPSASATRILTVVISRLDQSKGTVSEGLSNEKAQAGRDLYLTCHTGLWPSRQCLHV